MAEPCFFCQNTDHVIAQLHDYYDRWLKKRVCRNCIKDEYFMRSGLTKNIRRRFLCVMDGTVKEFLQEEIKRLENLHLIIATDKKDKWRIKKFLETMDLEAENTKLKRQKRDEVRNLVYNLKKNEINEKDRFHFEWALSCMVEINKSSFELANKIIEYIEYTNSVNNFNNSDFMSTFWEQYLSLRINKLINESPSLKDQIEADKHWIKNIYFSQTKLYGEERIDFVMDELLKKLNIN